MKSNSFKRWLVIPSGLFIVLSVPATTLFVDLNSPNPTPPYSDWSTAATNIQDAIDVFSDGDLILVTNGVYQSGGKLIPPSLLTNRVIIDKAITVQSINGSATTMIVGHQVGALDRSWNWWVHS